jgi:hypothetical protein
MSHFSTIPTKITNAEVLKSSLRDLGLRVIENGNVRGYNGQRPKADIVAVLDGEYDLGWLETENGTFSMIGDTWGVAKKHNLSELANSINSKYAVKMTLLAIKDNQGLGNANVHVLTPA